MHFWFRTQPQVSDAIRSGLVAGVEALSKKASEATGAMAADLAKRLLVFGPLERTSAEAVAAVFGSLVGVSLGAFAGTLARAAFDALVDKGRPRAFELSSLAAMHYRPGVRLAREALRLKEAGREVPARQFDRAVDHLEVALDLVDSEPQRQLLLLMLGLSYAQIPGSGEHSRARLASCGESLMANASQLQERANSLRRRAEQQLRLAESMPPPPKRPHGLVSMKGLAGGDYGIGHPAFIRYEASKLTAQAAELERSSQESRFLAAATGRLAETLLGVDLQKVGTPAA